MKMRSRLQTRLRQYPRLKALLTPIYAWMLSLRWRARNLLTRRSPIIYPLGQHLLKMYPDGMILESLYNGYFEPTERDFVAAFLKPGMIVVDAGANVGLYTIMASALVRETGRVHAFEPGQLNFGRLERNLRLNDCRNVIAARAALSNTNDPMILGIDPDHPALDGHRFVRPIGDGMQPASTEEIVTCKLLDESFLTCDFLKIDVEGAELAVLQGAENTLARSADITILLECTQNRTQVRELLGRHGFQSYVWDPDAQVLRSVAFDEGVGAGNIILRRHPWS